LVDVTDLVWQMQFADAWYKNDFAKILANHNRDIGDDYFFGNLLYRGVEANKLIPINSNIDLSVLPEDVIFYLSPIC
jgi:hypothetical protein